MRFMKFPLKGPYRTIVNKDKHQLTNAIKFKEIFLSNWHVTYNILRLQVAFGVYRLNTSKTCGSESSCILLIVDGIKNLIVQANSTEFKHIEAIFI